MTRTSRIGLGMAAGLALAVLLAACSTAGGASSATSPAPAPPAESETGGGAVAPDPVSPGNVRYLFRQDQPPVEVRTASLKLVDLVPDLVGLRSQALASTDDTAALSLTEDAPDTPWGELLAAGRPAVFREFASDPSNGEWLILVTDVVVPGDQDPIHPTAYRWSRADVEAYAECGIPDSGTDECTQTFFKQADVSVLAKPRGGLER